jgi:hypothetical protein
MQQVIMLTGVMINGVDRGASHSAVPRGTEGALLAIGIGVGSGVAVGGDGA